jgi:hypothetical protein
MVSCGTLYTYGVIMMNYYGINRGFMLLTILLFICGISFAQVPGKPDLIYPGIDQLDVSNTPTFEWSQGVGGIPDSYELQVTPDPTFFHVQYNIAGIIGTEYTLLTPLPNNGPYYWRVRGVNGDGAGLYSNFRKFTPATANGIVPVLSYPVNNILVYKALPMLKWYTQSTPNGTYHFEIEIVLQNDPFTGVATYTTAGGETFYEVTVPLAADTVYEWKVRVIKTAPAFMYIWSAASSFRTAPGIDGAPIPVPSWPKGNTIVYTDSPTLNWFSNLTVAGNLEYEVEFLESSVPFTGVPNLTGITGTTTAAPVTLVSSTGYHWRVRTVNTSNGNVSAWSETAEFSAAAGVDGLPIPITAWPVAGAEIYTVSPSLHWFLNSVPSNVVTYEVEIRPSNEAFTGTATYSGISGTSFQIITPLDDIIEYHWRVRSVDVGPPFRSSLWSNPAIFVTASGSNGAPVPIPSFPIDNMLIYVPKPTLNWFVNLAVSGTVEYEIELRETSVPLNGTPVYVAIPGTSFELTTALISNKNYHWSVRTRNLTTNDVSAWSDAAYFSTVDGADGTPTPVVSWPTANTTVYTETPTLVWFLNLASSNNLTYEIEIVEEADAYTGIPTYGGIPDKHFTIAIPPLVGGASYKWRVRTHNLTTHALSLWSTSGYFSIFEFANPARPFVGSPRNNESISVNKVNLSWFHSIPSFGVSKYRVEISKSPDFSNSLVVDNIQGLLHHFQLDEGGQHYWRVKAEGYSGISSGYSGKGSFNFSPLSDKNDESAIPLNFEVSQNYPNPFNPNTIIRFSIPTESIVKLSIYDILGREVKTLVNQYYSPGSYEVNWNGDNNFGEKLSSGTYFYKVAAGEYSKIMKMLLLK